MTAAIFGLIGTVVGGILTGVVTYVLDVRKERSTIRAESRVLHDDLKSVATACGLAEQAEEPGYLFFMRDAAGRVVDGWQAARPDFARSAGADDWLRMREAVHAVQRLLDAGRGLADPESIDPSARDGLLQQIAWEAHVVGRGEQVLRRLGDLPDYDVPDPEPDGVDGARHEEA